MQHLVLAEIDKGHRVVARPLIQLVRQQLQFRFRCVELDLQVITAKCDQHKLLKHSWHQAQHLVRGQS